MSWAYETYVNMSVSYKLCVKEHIAYGMSNSHSFYPSNLWYLVKLCCDVYNIWTGENPSWYVSACVCHEMNKKRYHNNNNNK